MTFRSGLTIPVFCLASGSVLAACAASDGSSSSRTSGGTKTGTGTTSGTTTQIDPVGTGSGGASTGASTGAGGIVGGGAGGGGGTGGSGPNPDAACIAEPRVGEQKPVDLFFMVDKSGSMNCEVGTAPTLCLGIPPPNGMTRWRAISEALNTFVNRPENGGMGVGMAFFPQLMQGTTNPLCNVTDYNTPAVPITLLPGAAPAISMAIMAQVPNGGTPTTPAISGALEYTKGYAATHLSRAVALVFASDGEPQGCNNNNVQTAAAAAAAALMASPPVRTYVLGVGPSLLNLNQIAAAGGTMKAFLVESGGAAELIKALDEIRKSTLTCDYNIPTLEGGKLDYTKVNVETKIGSSGMPQTIPPVANAAACGPMGGWYYDNPAAPTRITLCPATCGPLTMTAGSSMNVLIGCKTVPPIID
jgi:hypothetical protein